MSLDTSIKHFEKASNGILLKESLVSLLESLLSDSDFSATDLLGYNAGEFVTKEKLNAEYSDLKDSLDYVLVTSTNVTTLYNALSKISGIKDQIRLAINDLYGRNIVPTDPTNEYSYFEKYSDIIKDIPDYLGVRTTEEVTIEENGEVISDDDKAYSSVIVSIPEKTLTTRVISENGTYYAQQDGADGYEWVQVSVTGNVPTFTVKFWSEDHSNILYTALNVPYGGYAQFDGVYPESSDEEKIFVGWSPEPKNVTSDMDCYPVFDTVSTNFTLISDSWETIVANKGAGYPLGSYKRINFEAVTLDSFASGVSKTGLVGSSNLGTKPYMGNSYTYFMKVAAGEGGSTSTWLSCTGIGPLNYPFGVYVSNYNNWKDSKVREYLNSDEFLSIFPEVIRNAIIAVPKFSCSYYLAEGDPTEDELMSDVQTRDKIWMPSLREIIGDRSILLGQDGSGSYTTNALYKKTCMDNSELGISYKNVLFNGETGTIVGGATVSKMFNNEFSYHPLSSDINAFGLRDCICNRSNLYLTPSLSIPSEGDRIYYMDGCYQNTSTSSTQYGASPALRIGFCL